MFDVHKFKSCMLSSLVGLKSGWLEIVGQTSGQMIQTGSVSVINCMASNYETFVSHVTKNDKGSHRSTTCILDASILH